MKGKKKGILFLLITLLCLVAVGCGDKKESESDKKEEKKNTSESVLTCTQKEGTSSAVVKFYQNKSSYEITKVTMDMTMDMGSEEMAKAYKELACTDDEDEKQYNSCTATVDGTIVKSQMDFIPKYYLEDLEVEKVDKDTLENIKKKIETEEKKASCTIE